MQFNANPSAQLVLSFVMALRVAGIHVCLAGGAVRDILRGNEPKDFDLWVLPRVTGGIPTPIEVESAIAAAGLNPYADEMYDHKDYQAIRLDTVLKFTAEGIDIIWLNNAEGHPVQSVAEVFERFDFSINQEALVFHEDGSFTHASGFDGVNVAPIDMATIERARYERISAKYPDYDWSLVIDALAELDADPEQRQ